VNWLRARGASSPKVNAILLSMEKRFRCEYGGGEVGVVVVLLER
jgi:hypothetical protein